MDTQNLNLIIPDPHDSEKQAARFYHLDVDTASTRALAAELHVLRDVAARLAFNRARPRLIVGIDGRLTSDVEWIDDRIHRIRERLRTQQSGRAA